MSKTNLLAAKMNNISMKNKLVLSYILVVFVPILLVGLILTNGMRNMAMEQAEDEASINVERIERILKEVVLLATDISDKIYTDHNLIDILSREYKTTLDTYMDYKRYGEFDESISVYKDKIRHIRIYAFNRTLLNNGQFIPISKEIAALPWYNNALKANGRICWNYIYNEQKKNYYLSLTRLIKDVTGKSLGVLVIDINEEYFNSFLREEHFETIIIDDNDNIVAAKDPELIGKKSKILHLDQNIYENADGMLPIVYKNHSARAITRTFLPKHTNSHFRVVSIFSTDIIVSRANRARILGFSIMGLSLLLALTLIYIFSKAISDRVKHLSRDIHDVTLGNFEVSTSIEGEDEIGQLARDINYMIKSIRELIYEVYETNLQKKQLIIKQKEIELKMLANQVNPHFLFNILETIRMKAHHQGAIEIVQIVKQLGRILRSSLEAESKLIPFHREINLVKSYLELQKYRFEDKLNYTINVEDIAKDYMILPFLIQPIVENSVIHGLEKKIGKGVIDIDVQTTDGFLKIRISDNGVGMDDNRLLDIMQSLNTHENDVGKRIGIRNIYQRIKLHYGEKYGMNIYSQLNQGTRVELLLPGEGVMDVETTDCG